MTEFRNLAEEEQKAIPGLCILAAMADGSQSEAERGEMRRLVERYSAEGLDLAQTYQDTLAGRLSMPALASRVRSAEGKMLAYEMAVCICNVDDALTKSEQQFLSSLHRALDLDVSATSDFQAHAASLGVPPLTASLAQPPVLTSTSASSAPAAQGSDVDQIIMNRAVLAGALELMPQRLATMAIIPVQMQLVYQIGKLHGFDLNLSHTREFLATIGVGMTSQVVESYLTRLVRGATKRFAGKMVGSLVTQATESAFAFATTYAIGQAARKYYASGRTLSMEQLREIFSEMLQQGRSLKSQYAGDISHRSSQISAADLLSLGRQI